MTLAPTGLDQHDLARLSERRLRRLVAWHGEVAGDDDGRPFYGLAVRRLSLGLRLGMAEDELAYAHWVEQERRRVAADPTYLTEGYGHVQPEQQGALPIPFELWEAVEAAAERCVGARCQREVLEAFARERVVVVLKARQLGLTWLALHFSLWLMSYCEWLPRAKVLALSKREDDANKLLRRLRRINRLLPPFLRRPEDRETRGSLSRFKLAGRGEAQSLVSTPDVARSEQGDLFLWDEAAFTRNGGFDDTWTAALPTLGTLGRAIVISTGNGPAEVPGDGRGFAELYVEAASGRAAGEAEDPMYGIFLPDDVAPGRDADYRRRQMSLFKGKREAMEQEHPENEEQALRGKQGPKVYPLAGINAAERLGRELDALLAAGELVEPAALGDHPTLGSGYLANGADWGQNTHLLTIWETEGGGLYVPPGEHASYAVEVSQKWAEFHERLLEEVQAPDGGEAWPPMAETRYDSAGVEQVRVAAKLVTGGTPEAARLRRQWHLTQVGQEGSRRLQMELLSVRFNDHKSETIDYLRWLFERTARYYAAPEAKRERWGLIAISPANKVLLRQLRGLEYDDKNPEKVVKVDDHGPDALIAGAAPIAAVHRQRTTGPRHDEVNRRAA